MENRSKQQRGPWLHRPSVPLAGIPVFLLPLKPVQGLFYLFSIDFVLVTILPFLVTSSIAWFLLQPDLADTESPGWQWVAMLFGRNLLLLVVITGALQLYFYTFQLQGDSLRFDKKTLAVENRRFFLRDQVWDNMFWGCTWGVAIWTGYEGAFLIAYANEWIPGVTWNDNRVWFVLLFFTIPFWESFHFYFVHRFMHWKPVYSIVHEVHHRNVVVGPWSGVAMHPLEHLLYMSSVLIHLVIPSHPLHVIFHLHFLVLGSVQQHSGFEKLAFSGKTGMPMGDFFHQLHHRYFNCNFGNEFVPLDRWLRTYHDGSDDATKRMRGLVKSD